MARRGQATAPGAPQWATTSEAHPDVGRVAELLPPAESGARTFGRVVAVLVGRCGPAQYRVSVTGGDGRERPAQLVRVVRRKGDEDQGGEGGVQHGATVQRESAAGESDR